MEQIKLSVIKSALMLFAIFIIPYKHVFGLSQTNHYSEFERQNEVKERYLKEKINRGFSYPVAHAKKVIIYHEGYRRALDFYQKTAEPDLMMNIFITGHPDFTAGDEVWISQDGLKKIFEEKYEFEIIETFENLNVYKVITPTN